MAQVLSGVLGDVGATSIKPNSKCEDCKAAYPIYGLPKEQCR